MTLSRLTTELPVVLGCSTILFGGHSLDAALDGIARAGYRAVELCSIPGMAEHVPLGHGPAHYRDSGALVQAAGLTIDALGASVDVVAASVELGERERRQRLMALIDVARALGAPLLTTSSGGRSDDETSFAEAVAAFRALAGAATDAGVRVAVKPHVGAAVYSTPTALRFVEAIDSPALGLNWDPTHLYRAGERPEDSLAILGPYVLTVRLRDMRTRQGPPRTVEEQLPGNGALDLAAICARVRKLPIPSAVVEIVGAREYGLDAVQAVAERAFAGFAPLLAGSQ